MDDNYSMNHTTFVNTCSELTQRQSCYNDMHDKLYGI